MYLIIWLLCPVDLMFWFGYKVKMASVHMRESVFYPSKTNLMFSFASCSSQIFIWQHLSGQQKLPNEEALN